MPTLREQIIRLAYEHPELRVDLLPVLKFADGTYQDYVQRKKKDGEPPLDKDEWEARVNGKGDAGGKPPAPKDEKDEKKKEKPKKQVVPTHTNLFALWDEFKSDPDRVVTKVDAGRYSHLKRCMDAGLLEVAPGTKGVRLTEAGKAAFKEQDDKRSKVKEQHAEIDKKRQEEDAARAKKKEEEEAAKKSFKKSYPKPVTEVMEKHKLTDDDAEAVREFKKSKPTQGRPKSEAQLMAEFMQKAKPEMKARMKDMTPKEFMAMLAAISDEDEGKKAALRAGLIRLAHMHPEFRKDILPLLR